MKHPVLASVMLFTLFACGQTPIKELAQEPDKALVIIGFSGNLAWQKIFNNDYKTRSYKYSDIHENDVVLMPVSVGTRFRITEVTDDSKNKGLSFSFKRPPTLLIKRKGIYYYGVIESKTNAHNRVQSTIRTRVNKAMIAKIKNKHPELFRNEEIIYRAIPLDKIKLL